MITPSQKDLLKLSRSLAMELRSVLEAQEDREEHLNVESGEVYESHTKSMQILAQAEKVLFRRPRI